MRRVLVGVLIAMIAVVTACQDDVKVTKPATVVVVGDSILRQSAEEVTYALAAAGWRPVIDPRWGSGISGGGPVVASWPETVRNLVHAADPDVAVVELGTNGCGQCSTIPHGIDQLMHEMKSLERVYWLNVKVNSSGYPPDARTINAALERATDRWDNLEIVDMNERFKNPALLADDQIHLTRRGEVELAKLIVEVLPDTRP